MQHRALTAVAAALALTAGAIVRAEDAPPAAPKIGGFIDTSYGYDLSQPFSGMTTGRSYDYQHNTFRLNNAHLAITGAIGTVGYTIETDAGSDAMWNTAVVPSVVAGTAAFTSIDLQEAYITFEDPLASKFGLKVTDKLGKFVTVNGIEVIESGSNPTISRGYLFGLAEPFDHVGFIKTITVGPAAIGLGAVNGYDRATDNNDQLTGVANVNLTIGSLGMVNISGYSGADQFRSPGYSSRKKNTFDIYGVWHLPMVELWWQGNVGNEKVGYDATTKLSYWDRWSGGGLQPVIKLNETWSLGVRAEYYEITTPSIMDPSVLGNIRLTPPAGFANGGGGVVAASNVTATLSWAIAKGLTGRFEVRHDDADQNVFSSKDAADVYGGMRDDTTTLGMEMIVAF